MVYRVGMAASRNREVWGLLLMALFWTTSASGQSEPRGAESHWPLPPAEAERVLALEDFEILDVSGDVGGVMGVRKLAIRLPASGRELKVKWKRAPDGDADGWNNTPRKEIAAYEIQKWFLDPEDYVVPTVVVRCIPLASYAPLDPKAKPNLPGTACVLGAVVIWLENVGIEGPIYDEERFRSDPNYARHMANLNLLTYLIEHEDGRRNNFLTADDPTDRRTFSIDNGVSFGAKVKNWFVRNWNKIRVPALRRETIERLREVDETQVGALAVVAELRADDAGVLRPVEPSHVPHPRKGSRVEPGWIQLGLTRGEISDLQKRIDRLLADVDRERIVLF